MLLSITARFQCDRCAHKIEAEIDPVYQPPREWSMFDVGVDALRGIMTSVTASGEHLCRQCTTIEDEKS